MPRLTIAAAPREPSKVEAETIEDKRTGERIGGDRGRRYARRSAALRTRAIAALVGVGLIDERVGAPQLGRGDGGGFGGPGVAPPPLDPGAVAERDLGHGAAPGKRYGGSVRATSRAAAHRVRSTSSRPRRTRRISEVPASLL